MNFKITSRHIFGFITAICTCLFILYSKYVVNSVDEELIKETRTEFLTMYLFFICGLTIITFFGVLAKNKLLWHHSLWIVLYSIVTFLSIGAARSSNIAATIVPILIILSTVILGHFNKHQGVKKEGILLTLVWLIFFLLFKIF